MRRLFAYAFGNGGSALPCQTRPFDCVEYLGIPYGHGMRILAPQQKLPQFAFPEYSGGPPEYIGGFPGYSEGWGAKGRSRRSSVVQVDSRLCGGVLFPRVKGR